VTLRAPGGRAIALFALALASVAVTVWWHNTQFAR
jgi:hypothetical protein